MSAAQCSAPNIASATKAPSRRALGVRARRRGGGERRGGPRAEAATHATSATRRVPLSS